MTAVQELEMEVNNQSNYSFNTDRITHYLDLKGDGKSYVTGYISVPEVDLYNDLVTPAAMKSMLKQIAEKTISLDYEHEAFRDDNTILPVGKILEAKVDDRGLWVKAVLNKNSPKYKALWGSIKDGFLNAFSIAFKPLKTVEKAIGNAKVRLIEDLELLNVALTATPVNTGAVMTGHSMKSIMLKAIEDTKDEKVLVTKSLITKLMEEKSMGEETETIAPVEEVKEVTEEVKPEVAEVTEEAVEKIEESEAEVTPEVEAVAEPVEAVEEVVEPTVEEKALDKVVAELKAKIEEQAKELKEVKASPVFKSIVSDKPAEVIEKSIDMLSLVR